MPGLHITLDIFSWLIDLRRLAISWISNWLSMANKMTLHSFMLYSAAKHIARLEQEMAREDEGATAEQLSTFLAVRGADKWQVEFCRQAATELQPIVVTLVCLHTVKY